MITNSIDTTSYFILRGYQAPITPLNQKKGASAPETALLLELDSGVKLYVLYSDRILPDTGYFVIESTTLPDAYRLAQLIKAMFTIFAGMPQFEVDGECDLLEAVQRLPQSDWDEDRFLSEIKAVDNRHKIERHIDKIWINSLWGGYRLSSEKIQEGLDFISRVWGKPHIEESLEYAMESTYLFHGYLTSSHYNQEYAPQRPLTSDWALDKAFFENRCRYELAYLAAFKAIERIFNKSIKIGNTNDVFKSKSLSTISTKVLGPELTYRRKFEIFSNHTELLRFDEMLSHFARLRNEVASHGNRNPTAPTINSESIYEIQFFLKDLLHRLIYPEAYS